MNKSEDIIKMAAHFCKLCQLTRQMMSINISSTGIFSEAYLAIGHFKQFQDEQRKYINPPAELQRISHGFKRSGISALKKYDPITFALFSTDNDMFDCHEILKAYFMSPNSDQKMKTNCIAKVHQSCYLQKDMAFSRCFTEPPFFKYFDQNPIAQLNHLTLLYNNGHYQELVDTHKKLNPVPYVSISAIVMSALYK